MFTVAFHFGNDLDLLETWPDDTERTQLVDRARTLGAPCYSVQPEEDTWDGLTADALSTREMGSIPA